MSTASGAMHGAVAATMPARPRSSFHQDFAQRWRESVVDVARIPLNDPGTPDGACATIFVLSGGAGRGAMRVFFPDAW